MNAYGESSGRNNPHCIFCGKPHSLTEEAEQSHSSRNQFVLTFRVNVWIPSGLAQWRNGLQVIDKDSSAAEGTVSFLPALYALRSQLTRPVTSCCLCRAAQMPEECCCSPKSRRCLRQAKQAPFVHPHNHPPRLQGQNELITSAQMSLSQPHVYITHALAHPHARRQYCTAFGCVGRVKIRAESCLLMVLGGCCRAAECGGHKC